jgi:hypothetical protein
MAQYGVVQKLLAKDTMGVHAEPNEYVNTHKEKRSRNSSILNRPLARISDPAHEGSAQGQR